VLHHHHHHQQLDLFHQSFLLQIMIIIIIPPPPDYAINKSFIIYGACCNKTRQSEHWYYQEFQGSKFSNVIIKILLLKSSICYPLDIELPLYKIVNMKLIYIRSTMEPKNYSTIRSI